MELDLEQIAEGVLKAGETRAKDVIALLDLLRLLERLHQQVRDQYFHQALPSTRRELYKLLQAMEEAGGWPYIPRMTLQELISRYQGDPD